MKHPGRKPINFGKNLLFMIIPSQKFPEDYSCFKKITLFVSYRDINPICSGVIWTNRMSHFFFFFMKPNRVCQTRYDFPVPNMMPVEWNGLVHTKKS